MRLLARSYCVPECETQSLLIVFLFA